MLTLILSIEDPEEQFKVKNLYEEFGSIMANIAYRIIKDRSMAEDCMHDAFVKVIDNLEKIDATNKERTRNYLFCIVRNIAIDRYNEKQRNKQVELSDELLCANSDLWVYDRPKDEETDIEILLGISPLYRDILILKYVEGLDNSEIAKLLNISEATVRKRIERARKMVQEKEEKKYGTI